MAWEKPVPYVEETLRPFWDGLRRHQLLLMRCRECGAWYWPATYCRFHKNKPFFGSMEWAPSSGRGRVVAFNITRVAMRPAFAADVPYVYALVQMDEGPMLSSNVIGCAPESVRMDMPVVVEYRDVPELELTLPYFRPAEATGAVAAGA
jgi:uncharacterized OB-fold protein